MRIDEVRLDKGDDIRIRTSEGHELFIWFDDERLTVSNERTHKGARVVEATFDGWKDVTHEK